MRKLADMLLVRTFILSKIKFSNSAKAYSGKLNHSKNLLLNRVMSTKALSLLLNYTSQKNLVILKNMNNKDSFYSLPDSQICRKNSQQIFLFLHFIKNFQSFNSCMIRFGIKFLQIWFEKFKNVELSSQIYVQIKELDYLLRNQQFFCLKKRSPTQQKPTRGNLINQRVYF